MILLMNWQTMASTNVQSLGDTLVNLIVIVKNKNLVKIAKWRGYARGSINITKHKVKRER